MQLLFSADIADALLGVKKTTDDGGECSSTSDQTISRKRKIQEAEDETSSDANKKVTVKSLCRIISFKIFFITILIFIVDNLKYLS